MRNSAAVSFKYSFAQDDFVEWRCRSCPHSQLYKASRNFERLLTELILAVRRGYVEKSLIDKVQDSIAEIEYHLPEDKVDILDEFAFVLDDLLTGILKYGADWRFHSLLIEMKRIYEDIVWSLIVPYTETLTGYCAEEEKRRVLEKRTELLAQLKERIKNIEDKMVKYGIAITVEDLKKDLKRLVNQLPEEDRVKLIALR